MSENIDELWEELESFGAGAGASTRNLDDFDDEVRILSIIVVAVVVTELL